MAKRFVFGVRFHDERNIICAMPPPFVAYGHGGTTSTVVGGYDTLKKGPLDFTHLAGTPAEVRPNQPLCLA